MPISLSELSFVGQLTLLLLLLLSILSWGLIIDRYLRFVKSKKGFPQLIARISNIAQWSEWSSQSRMFDKLPSARTVRQVAQRAERETDPAALERYARIVGEAELGQIERGLPILATIGSTSPFIGLFGTVWGIIDAFIGIGRYGSPNLAVVAPGIAEALICTAAGLVVAVPAVVGYNYFVARVRDEARRIEQAADFILVFHNRAVTGGR